MPSPLNLTTPLRRTENMNGILGHEQIWPYTHKGLCSTKLYIYKYTDKKVCKRIIPQAQRLLTFCKTTEILEEYKMSGRWFSSMWLFLCVNCVSCPLCLGGVPLHNSCSLVNDSVCWTAPFPRWRPLNISYVITCRSKPGYRNYLTGKKRCEV